MFGSFDISSSGLTAQRLRMDLIASNIANVNTTRTIEGGPYRRKIPVFQERKPGHFKSLLLKMGNTTANKGVRVEKIAEDPVPFKRVYNPNHPDADQDGYVVMPNINIVSEMVDMIDASRAYEANVTAFNSSKNMAIKALEIGKG